MTSTWETESEEPVQEPVVENIQDSDEHRICVLCNTNEVKGMLRICDTCWNGLTSQPKVHLRLENSDKQSSGVVMWDHNTIGGGPFDKNPVPVGVWGKYGMEGADLTYWVSLCKPIDALHDMMTQLMYRIKEDNARVIQNYAKGTTRPSFSPARNPDYKRFKPKETPAAPPEPPVDTAFASLRDRLMKKGGS